MKGSPMKRNFGVGKSSPMTMKTTSPLHQELTEQQKREREEFKTNNPPSTGGVYTGNVEGEAIPQDIKNRAKELEKEMQANRDETNALLKKIQEYVALNSTGEGENTIWSSKEARDIYLEQYQIYQDNLLKDEGLVKGINQALIVDHPAAVSDSTGQAGQDFFKK